MNGPCWRYVLASDSMQIAHTCRVMDPLHTGDHECCCGYEWPIDDEEYAETQRAEERSDA